MFFSVYDAQHQSYYELLNVKLDMTADLLMLSIFNKGILFTAFKVV